MKNRLTTMALGIAISFIANVSSAANKNDWELHEKNWEDTVSYSEIHIADDSAGEWGPWSEFAQPAAGSVVGFLPQTITDPYTPTPTPINPDQPKLVAFGIYSNGSQYSESQDSSITPFYPGTIGVNSSFGPLVNNEGQWNVSWHIDPDTGKPVPNFPDSGPLSGTYFTGVPTPGTPYQGSAYTNTKSAWIEVSPKLSEYVSVAKLGKNEYTPATGYFVGKDELGNPYVLSKTEVTADSTQPTVCRGKCTWVMETPAKSSQTLGYYITGYSTPVSTIDTLRTANLTANYAGSSVLGSNVNVAVNFGSSSWSGQWTGGSGIAFNASGSISGASIQGASTTAGVTGTVNGSFFGPAANALAGRTDMTQGARQTADLFVTTKQ
ncbi:transferrin-binding protein-like solute binding protein [Sulfurirhabdus autotrophica]|uniref:Transferrin-binding protein B C-lobe/N-lobe beta-barrel domain-containing protein n=1 Tax=Sulfurirhabdus autotrophica TaxID=1706046 RepID=A0A4R3Y754_9PROT|nr:transferrin-binding protein-like solute binding protein [Sulfurirhabdus autotrophica]TCV86728.1 hypothetical protein EDC63_10689 [Sulfurirhabdus autotrophica]